MLIYLFILDFDSWNGKAKDKSAHTSQECNIRKSFFTNADEVGDQEMHEASTQASTQGMSFLLKSLPFIQKVWVDLGKL